MGIFKRTKESPKYFDEEPISIKFNILADFTLKHIETRADLNRAISAMEFMFSAKQKLGGIKSDEDTLAESEKFILHKKEGK